MDSRDNRGKAKQASEESSRKKSRTTKGKMIATNYYDMYPQDSYFQSPYIGPTSSIPPSIGLQFGQHYQRPSSDGNAGFASFLTATPAYNNYLQQTAIPGYNYQQQTAPPRYNYQQQTARPANNYQQQTAPSIYNYQQQTATPACNCQFLQQNLNSVYSNSSVNTDAGEYLNHGVQALMNAHRGRGVLQQSNIPIIGDYMVYDEYQEVESYVAKIKQTWPLTGCSIILDGWDDELTGKTLVNLLVDNIVGTVYMQTYDVTSQEEEEKVHLMGAHIEVLIEKVKPENVLQVISYENSPWLDKVRLYIQGKYKSIYWCISATFCLTMMLKNVASSLKLVRETIDNAKRITRLVHSNPFMLDLLKCRIGRMNEDYSLVRRGKIEAATPFLTLENLLLRRRDLRTIFASRVWKNSGVGSSENGKEVAKLVVDKEFWRKVSLVVRGGIPIVNVMKLFNDENGPLMGLLYETLDQLNETITEEVKEEPKIGFCEIIKDVWNQVLHSQIHAAGCYLNPSVFHADKVFADQEVKEGIRKAIFTIGNPKIRDQLESYKHALGVFGKGVFQRNNMSPVAWWRRFGGECRELQSFAIKILGQSCNGAECYGFRRSDAEQEYAKDKTSPAYLKLVNDRYVAYNTYLWQIRQSKMKFNMEATGAQPSDDWIVGDY